jgi:hypothetical protein
MAGHIALLGDSTFDNRAYTSGEPDVVTHLRPLLPSDWQTTLVAVDGSTIGDMPQQLARLPSGVTHLVLSVGGNDALLNSDVLASRVSSASGGLRAIGERSLAFERAYRAMLDRALAVGRQTTICTIYNGNFEGEWGTAARLGLMLFNDPILRIGFERDLSVIDLRLVCNEAEDYANPIEPSGRGGLKISKAIAATVAGVDAGTRRTTIYR